MDSTQHPAHQFPKALKRARLALDLPQEAFSLASSRTYVSTLERGLKSPTLSKVDALAQVLGLHPLTLLTLAYLPDGQPEAAQAALAQQVAREVRLVLDKAGR